MEYNIGDVFIDIRSVEPRRLTIVDIDKDEKETYYHFYITPDNKEDVYSSYMLKIFTDRWVFIHQQDVE